ncbi:unnamed protein product [Didymodactylos carnosus]|uniref:Protein kintoun n=1 Tax=Didymodactylos carnosus TaxID=1234261 RepID=A0A813TAR8_9BILA|nr:unnamed protein product [Didymodactylos carnosus]CAF0806404.1 unnamed protein product [Didymodactylos carnosus]CAF3549747.1 unnamed protein product [Didymodactylos carnosus]CAF3591836.1 unnamed protein product [Didymodactylos carnosus]
MVDSSFEKKLKDLELTSDEVNRLTDAFKNPEFRKLFAEYAEEISNPKNRDLYEKEIESIENHRGMNVTFIHPNPGHVLKTTLSGKSKCFINIATSNNVEKPSYEKEQANQSNNNSTNSWNQRSSGMHWNLPHCLAPPRHDFDNKSIPCTVYDVVYHPDTYRMAQTNKNFMQMIEESALDSIENNFQCKLDRYNIKRPKMKYKGVPSATIIRKKNENFIEEQQTNHYENNVDSNDSKDEFMSALLNFSSKSHTKENHKVIISNSHQTSLSTREPSTSQELTSCESPSSSDGYTVPTYKIIHRGEFDMQDLVQNSPIIQAKSTRCKELVVEIDLPLCTTSKNVDLDIYEKSLHIHCEKPKYDLTLDLPYPVRENDSHAKFDKKQHKLVITLAVMKQNDCVVDLADIAPAQIESVEENKKDDSNQVTNREKEELIVQKLLTVDTTNYSPIPFDFKQGVSHIALVLHLKNVDKSSINITNDGKHVYIKLCSLGEGCFPLSHQLYLDFDDGQECRVLEPNGITINHSNENVVVILKKADNSNLITFHAGINQQQLETKYFTSPPIPKVSSPPTSPVIINEPVSSESNMIAVHDQKTCSHKNDFLLSTTKKQEVMAVTDKKQNKKQARRMAKKARQAKVASDETTTDERKNGSVSSLSSSDNNQETAHTLKSDNTDKLREIKFKLDHTNQRSHKTNQIENTSLTSNESQLQEIEKKDKLSDMPKLLRLPSYRRHTSESSVDDEPGEYKLKSILKNSLKIRSLSESDYNADLSSDFQFNSLNVFDRTNDSSELDLSSSGSINNNNTNTTTDSTCVTPNGTNVKRVTFSNQVVRKVFKPNGPVSGMRKSSHNQRKNKNRQKRRDSVSLSSDGDTEMPNRDGHTKITTATESKTNNVESNVNSQKFSESSDDDTSEKGVDIKKKELGLEKKKQNGKDPTDNNDDGTQKEITKKTVGKGNETDDGDSNKNPFMLESILSW